MGARRVWLWGQPPRSSSVAEGPDRSGGFVGPMGAIIMGFIAGAFCYWGVNGVKRLLGMDDSLDVFAVHCIGGIAGALLTGVFASPKLGGTGVYDLAWLAHIVDVPFCFARTYEAITLVKAV
ncbi:ammonia channel protein AmtB [Paraburkholderia sp. JPY681]|nr:ammonia channel protein AmtB [Paraburkholderia atlantica]